MKQTIIILLVGILLLSSFQVLALPKTLQIKDIDTIEEIRIKPSIGENDEKDVDPDQLFEEGSLLVKLKKDIDLSTSQAITAAVDSVTCSDSNLGSVSSSRTIFTGLNINTELKKKHGLDRWIYLTIESEDLLAEVEKWKSNPFVDDAQLNHRMTFKLEPNDPYYHSLGSWGQDFQDLYGLHITDCAGAWDVTTGSSDVVVAVVDTGVDYNHEDIIENMWINEDEIPSNGKDDDYDGFTDNIYGADFSYYDGDPRDGHGHGTHCAGTISGVGNNAKGVVGVNWRVKIMAVKGLDDGGSGYSDGLANALRWAADNGAQVLSNSWGPYGGNPSDPILEAACRYVYDLDAILVFSAGNDNADVVDYSPANMAETIAVAATNYQDKKAGFSNWGNLIDVCAPGVDVLSLRAAGTDMYGDGSHIVDEYYYYASGTSMSGPHVAGLAALVRSYVPDFANYEVLERIISTADDIDDINLGWENLLGYGRINAGGALHIPEHNVGVQDVVALDHIQLGQDLQINTTVFNNGLNKESDAKVTLRVNGEDNDSVTIPLFHRTRQEISFSWTPQEEGIYTISVNITIMGTPEEDYADNERSKEVIIGVLNTNTHECFATIQAAIDDSDTTNDHTILAPPGIYFENITINKGITVTGRYQGQAITIIDGGLTGHPATITNFDNVTLSEFTLQHGTTGITIESSTNVTVKKTIVTENNIGVSLSHSSQSTLYLNDIIDNSQGIDIDSASSNNHLYYNLLDNVVNANDSGTDNQWDNGYTDGYQPDGGNYWSDYTGSDDFRGPDQNEPGSDGIGDTPYLIAGGTNQDRYPLMEPPGVLPNILYVDDDNIGGPWDGSREYPFQHVREAVDQARSGDKIFVYKGHYIEPTVGIWYKQLSLIGEDRNETILECFPRSGYVNNVISICHVNEVIITGFTIQKSGNNTWPWYESGINFLNAHNIVISGNIIRDCAFGLRMYSVFNNIISNNIFINNSYHPVLLFKSSNNIVSNNTFIENHNGIYLREATDNVLQGNIFFDNQYGNIDITSESSRNLVVENRFVTGRRTGVSIRDSSDNQIYHNVFLHDENAAEDNAVNSWDNGYPSGGNYWHYYEGIDADGDGIGDTPYDIPRGSNKDRYPIIQIPGIPRARIVSPEVGYLYFRNNKVCPWPFPLYLFKTCTIGSIDIVVNATEPQDGIEKVEFYLSWDDLQYTDTEPPYSWTWEKRGRIFDHRYVIRIKAIDNDGDFYEDEIMLIRFL